MADPSSPAPSPALTPTPAAMAAPEPSPAAAGPAGDAIAAGRPLQVGATGSIERLLDANLDRAREGLRVLEDWARFGLGRPDLVARCKDLRQRLGRCHQQRYLLARHSASDPAAGMAHPAQAERRGPEAVLRANASRVQEALRVLEEFGREGDAELAATASACRYALYDLELELLRAGQGGQARRRLLQECHLYLITQPGDGLEEAVAAALGAGVRLVQYRAKPGAADGQGPLDDRRRLAQAMALRQLCDRHGALLLINDRLDLALAVEADGVHLGQGDLPPALARRLLGPERLIGRSTHALPQLQQAIADGCDYVGVGPVHATPSKPGRTPVGLEYVREALACSPIPCFAIGGLDADRVAEVRRAGADRVAVVRAICSAEDPAAATTALLQQLGCRA
ncbi:MAG: thiamine phosphate synthase [Synechococcaceae cyanobacterium]|nr:thiamine phosphate synthase [Synechococcaceae cyanobacterium]